MTALPLHMRPDADDPELRVPYLDGSVDGRPHRFMLDTGAGVTRLCADAQIAALPVTGSKQSQGVFGTIHDELVTVESVQLGPITRSHMMVVRTHTDQRPSLVAMDVLGGKAMVLDYGNSSVDFVPSGSVPAAWPMLRSPNGQPFLRLSFPEAQALACWDTGAAMTAVHSAFHAAHQELFTPIGSSTGTDSVGQSQETPLYLMAACTTGGITLAAQRVAVVTLPQEPMRMDILLGYPAICQYVWTMDFPLNRWSASAVA